MTARRSLIPAWAGLLALMACHSGGPPSRPGPPSPPIGSLPTTSAVETPPGPLSSGSAESGRQPGRIVVLILENQEYERIIGSPEAPFVNGLAARSTLLTRSFAITHPSLPNYLALVGGSTFGIDSNCTSCTVDGRSLVDQLDAAGVRWRAYMEGMPSPCFLGPGAGRYAKKHDPFMYFDSVAGHPGRCGNVVPFGRLGADLTSGLPPFAWITPDLCHSTHDCPVADGDRWLSQWVPRILAALGPKGVLILTFDEGSTGAGCCGGTAAGGHIVTILAGPGARAGVRLGAPADHYSVLRLIEDNWALGHLGLAAARATPTIDGWRA